MANSVDPDQTAPIGAVCSGSKLFASIVNSSVMLGNYLQQTTSADDMFRCIFALRIKGYNAFNVYRRELAPGTVSLTDDRAQGDDSKHWANSNPYFA